MCEVNYNLLSYIRHITEHFLLDGKRCFMVKSATMSSLPVASNSTPGNLAVAGSAAPAPAGSGGASPTFSPLYQQIKALITQSLQSGEWKPGELIPSEVELAMRFKVSQGTVRKAIDELSAENLVVRRQGKGTFVATHHEARAQFRFLRLESDSGETHYPDNRIVDVKRLRAPAEIARALDIKSGDSVIFIKRVQSFDGAATIIDELWLPGLLFKGLTAERLIEYKGPMYGLFETEFGTRMIRASERVRAVGADADAAALLSVAPDTPLLSVERISYSYGDRPVEVRRSLYLTSRHHYQNELG
jgi:GntR family transcriptional regulator